MLLRMIHCVFTFVLAHLHVHSVHFSQVSPTETILTPTCPRLGRFGNQRSAATTSLGLIGSHVRVGFGPRPLRRLATLIFGLSGPQPLRRSPCPVVGHSVSALGHSRAWPNHHFVFPALGPSPLVTLLHLACLFCVCAQQSLGCSVSIPWPHSG